MSFSYNDMGIVLELRLNLSQQSAMQSSDEASEFARFLHSLRMNTFVINIYEHVRYLVRMFSGVLLVLN